ncbi:MAG: hypothetical protein QW520_05435 [Methanomassiliicoccales archaeon]
MDEVPLPQRPDIDAHNEIAIEEKWRKANEPALLASKKHLFYRGKLA